MRGRCMCGERGGPVSKIFQIYIYTELMSVDMNRRQKGDKANQH